MENFIIGVVASLVATGVVWVANNLRKLYKIYSFRGLWIQERSTDTGGDNKISLVELTVSLWSGRYKLSGSMVNLDGSVNCRWHSVFCSVEKRFNRIYYFYYGSNEDTPFSGHEGFGSIILENYKGTLKMDRGYFSDTTSKKSAITCKYFRVPKLDEAIEPRTLTEFMVNSEKYIQAIIEHKPKVLVET